MPLWILALAEKLSKTAPACLSGILLMGGFLFFYSSSNYASAKDLEILSSSIDKNFAVLLNRMSVSDKDREVADLQTQIRNKEREIADLEMVLADMEEPDSDSATVLSNRVFGLRQDLNDLRATLSVEYQNLQDVKRKLRAAEAMR